MIILIYLVFEIPIVTIHYDHFFFMTWNFYFRHITYLFTKKMNFSVKYCLNIIFYIKLVFNKVHIHFFFLLHVHVNEIHVITYYEILSSFFIKVIRRLNSYFMYDLSLILSKTNMNLYSFRKQSWYNKE